MEILVIEGMSEEGQVEVFINLASYAMRNCIHMQPGPGVSPAGSSLLSLVDRLALKALPEVGNVSTGNISELITGYHRNYYV